MNAVSPSGRISSTSMTSPPRKAHYEATLEAQRHRPDDGDDEDEIEASAALCGEWQDG